KKMGRFIFACQAGNGSGGNGSKIIVYFLCAAKALNRLVIIIEAVHLYSFYFILPEGGQLFHNITGRYQVVVIMLAVCGAGKQANEYGETRYFHIRPSVLVAVLTNILVFFIYNDR